MFRTVGSKCSAQHFAYILLFLSSSLRVRDQIYTCTKGPGILYVFVILLFLNVILIYYCWSQVFELATILSL